MSAEVLRKAAALIRERARAATPGPWFGNFGTRQVEVVSAEDDLIYRRVRDVQAPNDATHIASWHPAVALAVANLLSDLAIDYEDGAIDGTTHDSALNLARAYLGDAR